MKDERFSVYQFFPDGQYERVRTYCSFDEAIHAFRHYTTSVGARMGFTTRVIITDAGDCTVAEWQKDKGLVFPTEFSDYLKTHCPHCGNETKDLFSAAEGPEGEGKIHCEVCAKDF